MASGDDGERRARKYLLGEGLKHAESNYRCRQGEIDLIMRDGEHWVFVEVRLRADKRFGSAAESVTRRKQARVIKAAALYIQEKHIDAPCRFDVIAISGNELDWIPNAFQTE